jgi:Na+-translocating ferredoxin:NAD+ oxidoreductase RnfD subunit
VTPITTGVAILSKYAIRSRRANVFNPAVLGLVVTFFLFGTEQDWWGALPDLPLPFVGLFTVAGAYLAYRVNKLPAAITFLGVFYAFFTLTAFASDPATVAELFRAPDLNAALYFAFFMVTDPPTSPSRPRHQVIYAAIVATVSYGIFRYNGAVYFLLAGVLVGNVWEGVRRFRPGGRYAGA